jgi:hypothetical protein
MISSFIPPHLPVFGDTTLTRSFSRRHNAFCPQAGYIVTCCDGAGFVLVRGAPSVFHTLLGVCVLCWLGHSVARGNWVVDDAMCAHSLLPCANSLYSLLSRTRVYIPFLGSSLLQPSSLLQLRLSTQHVRNSCLEEHILLLVTWCTWKPERFPKAPQDPACGLEAASALQRRLP